MATSTRVTKFKPEKTFVVLEKPDVYDIPSPLPQYLVESIDVDLDGTLKINEKPNTKEVRIATVGNVDAGKCLGEYVKVMMHSGSSKDAKDIKIGDMVMGENYIPAKVTEIHTGEAQMFQIYEVSDSIGYDNSGDAIELIHRVPLFKATLNHQLVFKVINTTYIKDGFIYNKFACFNRNRINVVDNTVLIVDGDEPVLYYAEVVTQNNGAMDNTMRIISESPLYIPSGTLLNISCKEYYNILKKSSQVTQHLYGVRGFGNSNSKTDTRDGIFTFDMELMPNTEKYVGLVIDNPTKRFMICNNVLTHNSTLVGVLKTGQADNGRGLSRQSVFRHAHEQETGQTSSVSTQHIQVGNNVLNFYDLAGHEPYLKTTVHGLTSIPIDYGLLVVAANQGMERMTRQHLGIALEMELCLCVVITKIDIAPAHILEDNLKIIKRSFAKKRHIMEIETEEDLKKYYKDITNNDDGFMDMNICKQIVPIFKISNVKMTNVKLLQTFIFNLRSMRDWDTLQKQKPVYVIERTFSVPGIGLVLSGTVKSGTINKDDVVSIGPFYNGTYYLITIRSIHDNFDNTVTKLTAGESGCMAIRVKDNSEKSFITRMTISKGMVVVQEPVSVWQFDADIKVLLHPTTIRLGYEPVIHAGSAGHCAKIIAMDKENIRSNDTAKVTMAFKNGPQYIEVGTVFIFREGLTRGRGVITKIYDKSEENYQQFFKKK